MLGVLGPPKPPPIPPFHWRAAPPHPPPGAQPPGPDCFWIESPSPTGNRISLISVSESGLQKSPIVSSSLYECQRKSTTPQKIKISQEKL